jgi:hypothetical protein
MIFSYSESGTIDINGKTIPATIDTESPEYRNRAEYIARATGTVYAGTIISVAQSPNDNTANFTGTARFRLGKEPEVGVDAFNIRHAVLTAIAGIVGVYGLKNIVLQDYEEPKPPAPVEDWQEPGAKIGPPLPGQPGRFSIRHDKTPTGTVWTGASGRQYRLRQEGFGPLQMQVWIQE